MNSLTTDKYLKSDSRYNRQLIKLLNGWIVIHVFEHKEYIKSYISKDEGTTYNELNLMEAVQ